MSNTSINILSEITEINDEIISNRRWFHAHPELSYDEYKTAAKVVELLKSYGITEIFEYVAKTGVVALIRGSAPGPCIGLRADMDALPIQEVADIPYKSTNAGVMHACGHDGHIASLLASAKVLQQEKHKLKGVVKLIFQPAEEGYDGAGLMITEGVLDEGKLGPRVDYIYGNHLWSYNTVGGVHVQVGPVMASSDRFNIKVKGSGGHGAAPQGTIDAIVKASAVVMGLQTIVSRNLDPLDSGVITCGLIKGGHGYNIIADEVVIEGTCRAFKTNVQDLIKDRMRCVCHGVNEMYGGKVDFDYEYGYPPTINSYPEHVDVVIAAATKIVGADRAALPMKTMGAEDFSKFLLQRPGCFYFVAAGLKNDHRPHHKSVFDFDEAAMLVSASMHVQLVRDQLGL